MEFGENGFRNHDMTEVLLQQYQTSGGNSLKLFPVGIHKEGILSLTNDTSLWPGTIGYWMPYLHTLYTNIALVCGFALEFTLRKPQTGECMGE